jgi:hypothetical protein
MVPDPSRMPTPAFPVRAAPAGVGAKALRLNSWPGKLLAGLPTKSGRQTDPAATGSVLVQRSAVIVCAAWRHERGFGP